MGSKNDEIDFSKLEREFSAAVEADKKYSRENAAKFRAVEQRVGSYEEFRNIVLASNLQPLERKDIYSDTKVKQPLNAMCTSKERQLKSSKDAPQNDDIMGQNGIITELPISADSFLKTWKRSLTTNLSRFTYVIQLQTSAMAKVLTSESIGNLIGEIISTLDDCFDSTYLTIILDILSNLSLSKRFSLSMQFLSKSEKTALANLFEKLATEANEEEKIIIEDLKNRYLG
eukprot:Seg2753.3 transcript_id=Seg2753.3/GoldUCD/mRNA.D3Y31 product="Coiled-coil domain-containing protein 103" protein_id=Seg2753.3/GoldUCD/D3Y31